MTFWGKTEAGERRDGDSVKDEVIIPFVLGSDTVVDDDVDSSSSTTADAALDSRSRGFLSLFFSTTVSVERS